MAELLELRAQETLSQAEMTPAQRKNATLEILEAFLVAPLDGATVLLLLEDAHWSDSTTQALIERLLGRIEGDRALVVVTHRPELKTAWAEHPQATPLHCKQLGREHCAALARHVASRGAMDDALIREITSRSDGVPLYVEELTKAVLALQSPGSGAVPLTLQDSLMARLDRLGGAKDIAQTASVIGRQFPHDLLAMVAEAGDNELREGLERLRESGLIFAAGAEEEPAYSFNHALIQEAAYESLSRARRQALHAKIARALESGAAAGGASEPAVIAHHYSRAGEFEKAFHFWLLVADRSGERLAFVESIGALEFALGRSGAGRGSGAAREPEARCAAEARPRDRLPERPEGDRGRIGACRGLSAREGSQCRPAALPVRLGAVRERGAQPPVRQGQGPGR